MNNLTGSVLSDTDSVCPVCLKRIKAQRVLVGDDIYLKKRCTEHGLFSSIIWRGNPAYNEWNRENEEVRPKVALTQKNKGCPFDCGVCSEHKQQACCVLIEVTTQCNQHCSFCFAHSSNAHQQPSFEKIKDTLRFLIEISEDRPFNIQLSGGEPTLRDDLPEIIYAAKQMGFPYVQLNTNGQRLALDEEYLKRLIESGLSSVFLQFDGTNDDIYLQLRGKPLLDMKKQAINNCARYKVGVVLVPTLVPGINTGNIGKMIDFMLKSLPTVRGIHFQPVSYFGRFPHAPHDSDRITLPEVIQQIELQTKGRINLTDLKPLQSGCTLCSFKGSFTLMENGRIVCTEEEKVSCNCQQSKSTIIRARDYVKNKWMLWDDNENQENEDFKEWDQYVRRLKEYSFSITGMSFQDAWNLDLSRLQKCSINVLDIERRRLIPFCAYNLTDNRGRSLYRR